MNELNRFLKSPRGLAWLFALTLVGAIVLAFVMTTQRHFFERYAREKLGEPTVDAVHLADELRRGEVPAASISARVSPWVDPLYAIYIQRPDAQDDRVAEALVASAPDRVLLRLEKTFVAGDFDQRMRAAKFVEAAPRRAFVPVVERALVAARASRLSELASRLEGALAKCRTADK